MFLTVKPNPKGKRRKKGVSFLEYKKKRKGGGNKNYRKGVRFEYQWMWYLIYHGFDNVRSYASRGVCDIRSIPPRTAKVATACGAQCKNQKNADYLSPKERQKLLELNLKYNYVVCEPFKANRTCYVKLRPWELDGPVMTPEEFLRRVYGIKGMTWREFLAKHRERS